jgi:hypothetical protein
MVSLDAVLNQIDYVIDRPLREEYEHLLDVLLVAQEDLRVRFGLQCWTYSMRAYNAATAWGSEDPLIIDDKPAVYLIEVQIPIDGWTGVPLELVRTVVRTDSYGFLRLAEQWHSDGGEICTATQLRGVIEDIDREERARADRHKTGA